jgi:hypothetical protein
MESFQQSRLNISPHKHQNGDVHGYGNAHITPQNDFRCQGISATSRTRESAMMKDIEPFSSSLRRTADAGE